jgi:ribosomal protein L37AE/L43A
VRIKEVFSTYGNDFYATYQCEHCDHVTEKRPGYNDGYFHERVIPSWHCDGCGKNRAGEEREKVT